MSDVIETGFLSMSNFVFFHFEAFGAASLVGLSNALLAVTAYASEAFSTEWIASWPCTSSGVDLDVLFSECVMGTKETLNGCFLILFTEIYHCSCAV